MVIREIGQLVEEASLRLHADEHPPALLILQVITDVCTKQWMYLNDIHGEVSAFFQELACVWTEALLTVDLTTQERKRWTRQMTSWQARLGDWSIGAAFDAPQAALREGWETLALQRVFQGTSLQQSVWDDEPPAYAAVLTHARLTVLEQREQFQHYLSLAKAEGLTRAYVTMLVRQGQITEASPMDTSILSPLRMPWHWLRNCLSMVNTHTVSRWQSMDSLLKATACHWRSGFVITPGP